MNEIIKIVGFAFIALFLTLFFKKEREDVAIYISMCFGILILIFLALKITPILQLLQQLSVKANIKIIYIEVVLKVLAIAYIASFCSEVCRDAGANSIASKVEFGGKILILVIAIPVLMAVLETILKIMQVNI